MQYASNINKCFHVKKWKMWRKKLWKKNKLNFIKPGQAYRKMW